MRFCHVTTFYPPYSSGGDGIYVRRLSAALARRGHEVEVVHCADAFRLGGAGPAAAEPEPPGVTVHRLEHPLGPLSPLVTQQLGIPGLKARALRRILRPGRFDVVHFHNVSLVGGPGVLAYGDGVKLLTLHEHWLICPTHVLWKMGREPCLEKQCLRCVLHHRRPPQLWRYTGLVERSLRHLHACLAPSETTRCRHQAEGVAARIEHLPFFAPAEEAAPPGGRERLLAALGDEPYFLYVGRVEPLKGLQTLVPVIRDETPYRLVVAGEGSALDEVRRLAAGCERIRFLGAVSAGVARALQERAIACLVPSLAAEVSPLVVAEAAAAGTPVIARAVGSLPELTAQGAGLCYRSQPELLAALHRLASDPAEARRLGEAGRRLHAAEWSEERHLERYLGLIAELRGTTPRAPSAPRVPRPWPLVGHAAAFAVDKLAFLQRCARDPREAVPLRLAGPTFLLKSLRDVAHVLEAGHLGHEKTPRLASPRGRELAGHGLHTASAAEHRALRQPVQPAFLHGAVQRYLPALVAENDRRLAGWSGELRVRGESAALLRDAFGRCLLGPDWSEALARATDARRRFFQYWYSLPAGLADLLPVPVHARQRRARALLVAALEAGIARRRADGGNSDLLAALAGLRDDAGRPLPVARVVHEALTFNLTSYDSASDALAWTLLLLARHGELQEQLAAEVRAVLGERAPDAAALGKLELGGRVLDECLRLFPPTWIIVRVARDAELLPSGTPVPRGGRLYVSPWILHRDPRLWDDPERFDPGRFAPERRRAIPRLAYLPFGAGPRTCIGSPLARLALLAALALVAQRFRLTPTAGELPAPRPGLTLAPPDAATVRVERRAPAG